MVLNVPRGGVQRLPDAAEIRLAISSAGQRVRGCRRSRRLGGRARWRRRRRLSAREKESRGNNDSDAGDKGKPAEWSHRDEASKAEDVLHRIAAFMARELGRELVFLVRRIEVPGRLHRTGERLRIVIGE